MAEEGRTALKTYFETGDRPTQAQFVNLIDSNLNITDDDSDKITEGAINLFLTTSERAVLNNTSGTNTGDQDLSGKQDKQTTATTFDDTDITVDSSVEYSTIEVVTGSTHTITIAASGHVSGNYKLARYQFDVDCDLTISNYDATGSTLGTVNPIAAGTYNIWFYSSAFGVGVVIQNNTGTTPGTLSTPTIVITAGNAVLNYVISGIDANATAGVLEFSTDNINWTTDEDYSFSITSGVMDGLSNGTLYYVRFRVSGTGYLPSSYATDQGTPSVAITQLTAPTASEPTINSATAITVTCDDPNTSPQETTVLFRRATNSGMTTGLTTVQQAAGTTSYQWTGLTTGATYYFDVIAQGNGSTTSDSVASNVVSGVPADQLILLEEKVFDSAGTWTTYTAGGTTLTFVTDEGVTKARFYLPIISTACIIYKANMYTPGDLLKITITGIRHVGTNRLTITVGTGTAPLNYQEILSSEGTMVFDNIDTTGWTVDKYIILGRSPAPGGSITEGYIRSVKIEKYDI